MCGLAFRLKKCKNNLKNNWSSSVLSLLFNKWFNRFHWGACFLLNQVVQCWFYTDRDDSHHCGKANPEVKGRCVQTACDILLLFRRCDGHKVSSVSDTVAASRHPALPDACPSLIAVWAEGLPAVRRVTDRSWVRWREREDNMSHTHTQVNIYGWYFNNKYIIRTVWSFTDILSSDWAGFIIPSAIIGSQNLPTILIICPVVWLTLLPIPAIHQIGGNVQCVLLTKNFIFYDYNGLFWFISA